MDSTIRIFQALMMVGCANALLLRKLVRIESSSVAPYCALSSHTPTGQRRFAAWSVEYRFRTKRVGLPMVSKSNTGGNSRQSYSYCLSHSFGRSWTVLVRNRPNLGWNKTDQSFEDCVALRLWCWWILLYWSGEDIRLEHLS